MAKFNVISAYEASAEGASKKRAKKRRWRRGCRGTPLVHTDQFCVVFSGSQKKTANQNDNEEAGAATTAR